MPNDPSSQPTQPLTDAERCQPVYVHAYGLDRETWEKLFDRVADAAHALDEAVSCSGGNECALCAAQPTRAELAAEVDRLRAELDSMTRFAEGLREERDKRLRAEGERGVERDALAAKIEATAELHPAWFCETCNSPGPCLTRLRLGLDQDGEGQANG